MKTSIRIKQLFSNLLINLMMILISLLIFSCNNFSNDASSSQEIIEQPSALLNSNKGTIKIKLIGPESQQVTKQRTALPYIPVIGEFSNFVLKGKLGETVYTLGSWSSSDDLDDESIELEEGNWELTLSANYNGFTFTSVKNITLNSGTIQQVSFVLSSENTRGGLYLCTKISNSTTVNHVKYQLKKFPSDTLVDSGNLSVHENSAYKSVELEKDNSDALINGTYRITLFFYGDSQERLLLNTYNELIRIKGGFTSNINRWIDLNGIYTITYNYPSDATIVSGSLVENYSINSIYSEIEFPELSKAGYDWQGWYTLPNGNGSPVTSLPEGSSGNKTYYAYFTLHSYTITYELYGGSHVSPNPTSYTIEDDILLNPAEKAEYSFGGWYTDTNWTTNVSRIEPGTTGNISLYAKWNLIPYNITYELNGGTNSPTNPTSYTIENNISFAAASKDYYTFAGWFTDENFAADSQVTGYTAGTITGPIVIYAKWTPVQFPITYELNGGTNSSSNPTSFNIEDNIIFADPSKTNYIFQGWYTDSAFTRPITEITAGEQTEAITLYAKWIPETSHVNITPNGFPGSYICNWTATGTSPNISISITIKDSSGTNIITPDSFSVQVCINGEPSGYTFTSQSFTYPSAISGFAAPSNSSFYVTVTIGTYTYDFYAVSP